MKMTVDLLSEMLGALLVLSLNMLYTCVCLTVQDEGPERDAGRPGVLLRFSGDSGLEERNTSCGSCLLERKEGRK